MGKIIIGLLLLFCFSCTVSVDENDVVGGSKGGCPYDNIVVDVDKVYKGGRMIIFKDTTTMKYYFWYNGAMVKVN